MSQGFHKLTVKEVIQETADAKTIVFDIPADLKEIFAYEAGQYLTFESEINGENVRRSYSLCTFDGVDASPAVTVKRVEGGRMSNFFNDHVAAGTELDVMPPLGNFKAELNESNAKHYVLFAGGSGITPVFGIAKAVLSTEPNSQVTLVYANRDQDSVIFKDGLKNLEEQSNGRFKVLHSFDKAPFTWFGLKGQLTEEKVQNIVKNKIGGSFDTYPFYICGPGPMMSVIKNGLLGTGVPKENINIEYFTAPGSSDSSETEDTTAEQGFDGSAEVTLTVYGKTHTIEVDEHSTILDAAMKEGIDPPYSCTVGVCTTCRAKVSQGSVHMLEREGLSDKEIEDGFVLTCQSQPRSAKIVLSFE